MPNGSATTVVSLVMGRAKVVSILEQSIHGGIYLQHTGEKDTVFVLEDGATLKNVIIGADQKEGVYCKGSCNLEFVWFENVCEGWSPT